MGHPNVYEREATHSIKSSRVRYPERHRLSRMTLERQLRGLEIEIEAMLPSETRVPQERKRRAALCARFNLRLTVLNSAAYATLTTLIECFGRCISSS